ncbi:hypothetical protein N2E94_08540 [Leuconostoc citreum]|uniref:hypothetical protein n=1 Tax=Leuconostoc citreum TaxID=33964 RepID=UPI000246598A|nr:hypothetical protein [Leuconostoc citreum]CCF28473.1 Prophage Lp2 protein 7 [Leuconostoc citreum LBAE E16]
MNKKLLIIIGILTLTVVGLVGYLAGNQSDNEAKQATKYTKSNKSANNSNSTSSTISTSSSSNEVVSTSDAERQLNSGQSIDGKIIDVEILNVVNASELGQNIQAGEHLNFYPAKQQYNLKTGEHIKFKVISVKSAVGSWLITGNVVK